MAHMVPVRSENDNRFTTDEYQRGRHAKSKIASRFEIKTFAEPSHGARPQRLDQPMMQQ